MIFQIVELQIQPDKMDATMALLENLVAGSRAEEGISYYMPTVSTEDPNRLIMLEEYADEAAMTAHRDTSHLKAALGEIGAYLAGKPSYRVYQVAEVEVK
ncbi:MAG: putative quinol monooxygenase [Chloroflexota bacterium]